MKSAPLGVTGGYFQGFNLDPHLYSGAHALFFTISLFSPPFGLEKNFVLATF